MSRDEMTAPRRTRLSGSGRVRALLSLGIVLGLGSVGTLAAWSSNATATTGVFSTGAIDLKLNDSDGPEGTPYPFTLAMAPMRPGQSTAAMLQVQNRGSIAFNYGATVKAVADSTGSGDAAALASNLTVTVFPGGTVSGSAPNRSCTGSALASPPTLSTTASKRLVPSRGPRQPLSNENLCIRVEFKATGTGSWPNPVNYPTQAQGQKLNVLFEFEATAPSP